MKLEPPPSPEAEFLADPRPRLNEPPPVRLVAVADVSVIARAGLERELDDFYVQLLGFEREDVAMRRSRPDALLLPARLHKSPAYTDVRAPVRSESVADTGIISGPGAMAGPVYRAANCRLRFVTMEPPVERDGIRLQGICVPSLASLESELLELEIKFTPQQGLVPGQRSLLLQDPAGNWLELVESTVW